MAPSGDTSGVAAQGDSAQKRMSCWTEEESLDVVLMLVLTVMYAFMMGCSGHQSPRLWTHPADRSRYHTSLSYWVDHAKLLEKGHFDGLFLADVLGGYDVYNKNLDAALRSGSQFPVIDPLLLVSAMAAATKDLIWPDRHHQLPAPLRAGQEVQHLGPPDQRPSRLEHCHRLPRQRCQAVWRQEAGSPRQTIHDASKEIYTKPERVRSINHTGQYYKNVPGPHICEPSPQRTPVIYQAGSSGPGMAFAGKHAEVIFIATHKPEVAKKRVDAARQEAKAAGRDPSTIKVLALLCPVIGRTDEEAQAKYEEHFKHGSEEGTLALFGGWTRMDLGSYGEDEELRATESNAIKSAVENFASQDPSVPKWTKKAVADQIKSGGLGPTIVGGPESIADQLEQWMQLSSANGFNLAYTLAPGMFEDLVELVIPILKRGRVWSKYPSAAQPEKESFSAGPQQGYGPNETIGLTSREKIYGVGQKRLRSDHYGSKFTWKAGQKPPALD